MRNNLDHNAPPKVPAWIWGLVVLGVVLSWLPLALIARSRAVKTERQPVHLFLDMDFQPRYGPQDSQDAALAVRFTDGRAMRPPVPGTVAYRAGTGVGLDDESYDHFNFGYELDGNLEPVLVDVQIGGATVQQPRYYEDFPPNLAVDEKFLARGQQRYNIYCAVCHGRSGYGDGPVHDRVMQRQAMTPTAVAGWVPPRNFHLPEMAAMPAGQIYDRITRGVFAVDPQTGHKTYTMWPYAAQINPEDRWAIVAYIRVLQKAQFYPIEELSDELRSKIDTKAAPIMHPAAAKVITVPPAPFKEEELDDPGLIAEGKELFHGAKICFTCHQTDPNIVAPAGIALNAPAYIGSFWGKFEQVHDGFNADGTMGPVVKVRFDADYFYESVTQPMKRIVKGSIAGMAVPPSTDEEIKALAAYVKSLSKDQP